MIRPFFATQRARRSAGAEQEIGTDPGRRARRNGASRLAFPCLIVSVLWLAGCATRPAQDNTARLIARPDFKAAARAAPGWVRDALHTITDLEAQASAHP